ncbi:U3 small nucleolar ribonucleoprotein [Actinidia chinensis var. chinensis]|uniref:U3 small nucleolar ribonucleoprotein n=1 Tax=Actinidia chinensis var. chinensis TaxID=1590841 RepID=A0A2R6PUC4_ACTCC|nr:U3 small nucleolar ribonucleoprotein [Actinidia chinensis var. chinensis]
MADLESLRRLKSAEPPLYLSPSTDLSQVAREASQNMFSFLKPFAPKSPFDRLLVDGFDAEQIWQQIDLQSHPLISGLRRQLKKFEKNPEEIAKFFSQSEKKEEQEREKEDGLKREEELDGVEDDDLEGFDDDGDDGEEEEESGEEEEEEEGGVGVEDKFLKIKELEEYLEGDEAREYGLKEKKGDEKLSNGDEKDDEEDEEGDELGLFGADTDDEDGANEFESARYEDFFGSKKKNDQKRKPKLIDASDDLSSDDEDIDDKAFENQKQNLSTHEKHLEKLHAKIEQMEQANLEPKTWTMQGEVTAAKRPKNSALEVDLDFEHNVRPAPVITEEGHFDDVQKAPDLPSKAPREMKELDETKSKKGLAEIYEDEYVQKTGLVSAALSFSDEQKKEASMLFKKLCLKLDALSHFHFTPKPVVEDMSIQANVPALAMEEIAPLAVSDAAMLAPEEVFAGKGDIKEETELTQAERKRRRANKKRKFKADSEKRTATKKAQESAVPNHADGKGES